MLLCFPRIARPHHHHPRLPILPFQSSHLYTDGAPKVAYGRRNGLLQQGESHYGHETVLPGLALAGALGLSPGLGGMVSGVAGALVAERLSQGSKPGDSRDEAVLNTVLAGFLGLGVLLAVVALAGRALKRR